MRVIKIRKSEVEIKNTIIVYDEKYVVDENGEEIFDRDIEIENDKKLFDEYKKIKGLLTSKEIKNIRKKYDLNQKEFAKILGLGEVSINRFENGSIQTESIDSMIRLANEVPNMKLLINKNKEHISLVLYEKVSNILKELEIMKEHALVDLKVFDVQNEKLDTVSVNLIADNIIKEYNELKHYIAIKYNVDREYITNLKLQKLLYYVQGISLKLYGKPAFNERIIAWNYGPVVEKIYNEYKNGKEGIKEPKEKEEVCTALQRIISNVVTTYGNIEATKLIEFTHNEEPWKKTKRNCEIKLKDIEDYFNLIYDI